MNVDEKAHAQSQQKRRKFPRHVIMCRARIRVGSRQYAGYLHNIGQGGARLRTITPIRRLGKVILRLPCRPSTANCAGPIPTMPAWRSN